MKINGKVIECPQHTLTRVLVGIHSEDIHAIIETFNLKYFNETNGLIQ